MKDTVVIIGAGIQGVSSAYNIAKNSKNNNIVVVESFDKPGRGSSGRSGSMLMKSRENKEKIELSKYSFNRFDSFFREFGEELERKRIGFLSLVNSKLEKRFMDEHKIRSSLGVDSQILSCAKIKKICPGLKLENIVFGLLGPEDCVINPNQVLSAFKKEASKLEVKFRLNETVIDIICNGNEIKGVKTTKGIIECQKVINAGGANAKKIGSWIDVDLPITNKRRSLYYVDTDSNQFNSGPMVEDASIEWYYRTISKNRVLIGMGLEPDEVPTNGPNMEYLPEIIKTTKLITDDLYPFKVFGGVSGIRPITKDKLPIIGPVKNIIGYFNNCGWGGEGIMHSPAGGTIIGDWLNETHNYPYDKECFLQNRFLT